MLYPTELTNCGIYEGIEPSTLRLNAECSTLELIDLWPISTVEHGNGSAARARGADKPQRNDENRRALIKTRTPMSTGFTKFILVGALEHQRKAAFLAVFDKHDIGLQRIFIGQKIAHGFHLL